MTIYDVSFYDSLSLSYLTLKTSVFTRRFWPMMLAKYFIEQRYHASNPFWYLCFFFTRWWNCWILRDVFRIVLALFAQHIKNVSVDLHSNELLVWRHCPHGSFFQRICTCFCWITTSLQVYFGPLEEVYSSVQVFFMLTNFST